MKFEIGDIVEGVITGVQPYGTFVKLEDGFYGLIHISEISYRFVSNIHSYVKEGDTVQAKVIDIDAENHQLRLSLKAVNTSSRRRRYNPHSRMPLKMKIGFAPIESKLPEWIAEAKQEMAEAQKSADLGEKK